MAESFIKNLLRDKDFSPNSRYIHDPDDAPEFDILFGGNSIGRFVQASKTALGDTIEEKSLDRD